MNTRAILTVVVCLLTSAAVRGAAVWGECYLEGQSNHGLTVVEIDDSVLHAPVSTDCDGSYAWAAVAPLQYHTFAFTHPGYEPETRVWWIPLGGGALPDVTLQRKAACDPDSWDDYPWSPPDTPIAFPSDEGVHNPTSTYRAEWWYINVHLTDEDNDDYGGFVAFFKPPVLGLPGMVLQSIIPLDDGVPRYSHDEFPATFLAETDWLDVVAGGNRLTNRACGGDLLPFEYHLYAGWVEGGVVWMELDMKCLKPPMPVGGDGLVEFGDEAWSYYYSHPRLEVLGTLHLPGFPALGKSVHGHAWIDHQWANLTTDVITWEWLSIQLDDDREIMVANVWVADEPMGSFSGGLNYYDESCSLSILDDYDLTTLATWTDPVTGKEFATEWHVYEPTQQIDLVVTARFDDQIMRITENQIFPTCFWEGACTVSGTIGGQPVAGTAYAEMTHQADTVVPCAGDLDGDGDTDLADLADLLAAYGTCAGEPGFDEAADFSGNGCVDLADLAFLLGDYGCSP